MRRFFLLFIATAFLLVYTTAYTAEPIPFNDFISITEKVLDALDEIEVVFSDPSSIRLEVEMAFKRMNIEMLKYNRYVQDWRKVPGKQADIVKAIATSQIIYDTVWNKIQLGEEGFYGKTHKEARHAAQKAREVFIRYKGSK
ncbi:hypothetical protein PITCH_A1580003 [uncultured Desulfobacterium sp.]|uniref:Uncharacterized protein n=1 Tax=uncultured Desulfobacterium sp. TaxID=201089 RepID=A0A445MTQ9_9BACT|nr:hypothetical protein PITCH_A1580003 [uncultured Desulfobacterium sp.]